MRAALLVLSLLTLLSIPASAATRAVRWTAHGPLGGTISAIEVDPRAPSTIYVGTMGAGVYKSVDGGRTWSRRSDGLPPDTFVTGLDLAPADPSVLYLKHNNTSRIYVSTNGARTWRLLPPVDASFDRLVVDPTDARTVFLPGTSGLLKSVDGGRTWTRMPGLQQPHSLAISPSHPNVMYAEDGGFLMRTLDGGVSWARRSARPSSYDIFTTDLRDPSTLYVSIPAEGLFRSTDGGATFTRLEGQSRLPDFDAFAIDPTDTRRLYVAAGTDSIFRSNDGGSTWQRISRRLPREDVLDLETVPGGSRVYLGLSHRGFYRSTDRGQHWAQSNRQLVAAGIPALAADPFAPRTAYAGTWRGGVWRTTDGGWHWAQHGLSGRIVFGFAFDPKRPRRMYAAADNSVFRTVGGGAWRRVFSIRNRSVDAVALAPSAPRVVYAATFEGGTFRSLDGGATWKATTIPDYTRVASFAVHPRRPLVVWFGTARDGVLRSTNGGRTWKRPRNRASDGWEIHELLLDPRNPRVLYAAASEAGVLKSTDGGATWASANAGIGRTELGPIPIYGIAIDARRPNVLYAGGFSATGGGHVYRSTNGARTWTDITGGMTTSWTWSLALSSTGRMLYAGTTTYGVEDGGGVFTARVH